MPGVQPVPTNEAAAADWVRVRREFPGSAMFSTVQYSFSTDASLRGAPSGHLVTIREVRLAAGAEFIVMVCGDIMTMPGLPKVPSSNAIDVNTKGQIVGLF